MQQRTGIIPSRIVVGKKCVIHKSCTSQDRSIHHVQEDSSLCVNKHPYFRYQGTLLESLFFPLYTWLLISNQYIHPAVLWSRPVGKIWHPDQLESKAHKSQVITNWYISNNRQRNNLKIRWFTCINLSICSFWASSSAIQICCTQSIAYRIWCIAVSRNIHCTVLPIWIWRIAHTQRPICESAVSSGPWHYHRGCIDICHMDLHMHNLSHKWYQKIQFKSLCIAFRHSFKFGFWQFCYRWEVAVFMKWLLPRIKELPRLMPASITYKLQR